jgi:endonuclease YncB( thermonuclease family)
MAASPGRAAELVIVDGDTLKVDGTTFRLDGVDAPEKDQTCLDEKGAAWTCGIDASNRLAELTAKHAVQCQDRGPDTVYSTRRIGICLADGVSLNRTLVREGWALNFEPYAKGRFEQDEADARDNRRGLWKGCFAAPWDRRWRKSTAKLLGSSCVSGNEKKGRDILFPDNPAMPPGCSIKGKVALTWPRGSF